MTTMRPTVRISEPFAAILRKSDIRPKQLQVEFDRRALRQQRLRMGGGDRFLRRIEARTSLRPVTISRNHANILLYTWGGNPEWQYHEISRKTAELFIPALLPETVLWSCISKPLSSFMRSEFFDDLILTGWSVGSRRTNLIVQPQFIDV
jgi:hypothetical protein